MTSSGAMIAAAMLALVATAAAQLAKIDTVYKPTETRMFSIPISPNMFNWTYQEFDKQYRFTASLRGKPELPAWLRYVYSGRHHAGFVFGTPPRGVQSPVVLEVIGLNRQDYETRKLLLTLDVQRLDSRSLAVNQLLLKIDNLNVEDLLDQHRMDQLIEIFTTKLWPNSAGELYPTFLASAIDLGARLPLKPSEGEGVVVRLGSARPLSGELRRLREEVQPLARLASCPREFKRTSVERLFRLAAFTLDWCRFKLYEVKYTIDSSSLREILDDAPVEEKNYTETLDVYQMSLRSPRRGDVPARSYAREVLLAVATPLLLVLLPAAALAAALCCRHVSVPDAEFLANIFHLCEEYHAARRNQKTGRVELCRYAGATEHTHLDSGSTKSAGVSPNNSIARPYSPKSTTNLAGSYNRPQPPPYLGSNTNTLVLRKSTPSTCSGVSPEHNRTLEESLKLLNEANIAMDSEDIEENLLKDQIIDSIDGMEDYVPLKTDGYVTMKADLGYVSIKADATAFGNGGVGKMGI